MADVKDKMSREVPAAVPPLSDQLGSGGGVYGSDDDGEANVRH